MKCPITGKRCPYVECVPICWRQTVKEDAQRWIAQQTERSMKIYRKRKK